jgi:beta-glucosidase
MLLRSTDFFGLNHYSTSFVSDSNTTDINNVNGSVKSQFTYPDGRYIGARGEPSWLYNVPWGFKNLLLYVSERYNHPEIYITENGTRTLPRILCAS